MRELPQVCADVQSEIDGEVIKYLPSLNYSTYSIVPSDLTRLRARSDRAKSSAHCLARVLSIPIESCFVPRVNIF